MSHWFLSFAAVAALVLAVCSVWRVEAFATVDHFDGPGCNETEFFRRDSAQNGVCFWQQQAGATRWQCQPDGSIRTWLCDNCSVPCYPENGAVADTFFPGCINEAVGLYAARQRSYRVTCGPVPEVPEPHNNTLGVVLKTFTLANSACNDAVEPGTLHSASWYRSGYCQYNDVRNRKHTCALGYPQLKFYDPSLDGCLVNTLITDLSQGCGVQFDNSRYWKCGYAHFDGLVPLAPQAPTTSTAVEVAKPQYAYYGTFEKYSGMGCVDSQLVNRFSRRVDFCECSANFCEKYVCTDFGIREYAYRANTSCTGSYTISDYPSTCTPRAPYGNQYSIKAFCSTALPAAVGAPTGVTTFRYDVTNVYCNKSAPREPQFEIANFFRDGCVIPAAQASATANATHFTTQSFNSSATTCSNLLFRTSVSVQALNTCSNATQPDGSIARIRYAYGTPNFASQIADPPTASPPIAVPAPVAAPPTTSSQTPVATAPIASNTPTATAPIAAAPTFSTAPDTTAPTISSPTGSNAPDAASPIASSPIASNAPDAAAPIASSPIASPNPKEPAPTVDSPTASPVSNADAPVQSSPTASPAPGAAAANTSVGSFVAAAMSFIFASLSVSILCS